MSTYVQQWVNIEDLSKETHGNPRYYISIGTEWGPDGIIAFLVLKKVEEGQSDGILYYSSETVCKEEMLRAVKALSNGKMTNVVCSGVFTDGSVKFWFSGDLPDGLFVTHECSYPDLGSW